MGDEIVGAVEEEEERNEGLECCVVGILIVSALPSFLSQLLRFSIFSSSQHSTCNTRYERPSYSHISP